MTDYGEHKPVLLEECLEFLKPENNPPFSYLDATFGAGGHTLAFIKKYDIAQAVGLDQDSEAIKNSQSFLKENGLEDKVKVIHTNYEDYFSKESEEKFDIILADIGVSSHQFDSPERGFSFRYDAELDMRMDQSKELSAKEVINTYSKEELADIFFHLGEEKFSRRISDIICEQRLKSKIETTKELEDICFHAYPKKMRFCKTHPATRTFQALRIYVNDELGVLKRSIPQMVKCLKAGGKLGIISFHSLEDRIVKRLFKELYQNDQEHLKILTKRPVVADKDETENNPRSRSAKLRAIQKLVVN